MEFTSWAPKSYGASDLQLHTSCWCMALELYISIHMYGPHREGLFKPHGRESSSRAKSDMCWSWPCTTKVLCMKEFSFNTCWIEYRFQVGISISFTIIFTSFSHTLWNLPFQAKAYNLNFIFFQILKNIFHKIFKYPLKISTSILILFILFSHTLLLPCKATQSLKTKWVA